MEPSCFGQLSVMLLVVPESTFSKQQKKFWVILILLISTFSTFSFFSALLLIIRILVSTENTKTRLILIVLFVLTCLFLVAIQMSGQSTIKLPGSERMIFS